MKPERPMTRDDGYWRKSPKIERNVPFLRQKKVRLGTERNAPKIFMSCFNCNDI